MQFLPFQNTNGAGLSRDLEGAILGQSIKRILIREIYPLQIEGEKSRGEEMKKPEMSEYKVKSWIELELEIATLDDII